MQLWKERYTKFSKFDAMKFSIRGLHVAVEGILFLAPWLSCDTAFCRFGVTAAVVSTAVSSLLAYGSARLGRLGLQSLGGLGGVASCGPRLTIHTVGNPKWHLMWHLMRHLMRHLMWHLTECQGNVYSSMSLFQLTFKQS